LPKLKVNSKKFSKSSRLSIGEARKWAAALAVEFLLNLSEDPQALARFLVETGYDPAELRSIIAQPSFVDAIFHYPCSDDSVLISFASKQGIDPAAIGSLRQALASADWHED
jgi:Protein of unknown function (DUF3572)